MNGDWLTLTTYLGERDRTGGSFTADALLDLFQRRGVRASLLLRGIEGFGLKHHLQTDRLLTLSEDLPMISIAIDSRERIVAALDEINSLGEHGLTTLESTRLVTGPAGSPTVGPEPGASVKLAVLLGRRQRIDGRPAHLEVVGLLHRLGLEGATVLLGVDGTMRGERRRARFFAANSGVPQMVVAVGGAARVADAVSELSRLLPEPLLAIDPVEVLKRDGNRLDALSGPGGQPDGPATWQKLTVYAGEQARHDGLLLYPQLIRRLREAGALGATAIRGIWGYHGDHEPHGDSIWSVRRRVPVVTTVVDTPGHCRDWFRIIDELTDQTGLVTSESVPAMQSRASGTRHGGLGLPEERGRSPEPDPGS